MARPNKPWFWKARKEWYVTIDGERHRLGPDKDDATTEFHELMSKRTSDVRKDAVAVIIDKFLDWTKKNRSEETFKWYKKHCEAFAEHLDDQRLAGVPAASLKTHHVQDWIDSHKDWSDGTKHGAWRALYRTFNWAVKQEYMEKNPSTNVEKPSQPRRENTITQKEFDNLLRHVQDQEFRDLLTVHWDTGCRPQESLRVTKANVQDHHWVFQPKEGKRHRGRKQIRFVYLTDQALEITQRRILKYPEGPLFRNTEGNPWTVYSVDCRFKRLASKKRFGRKICLYDLRHSFDNRLRDAGVDSIDIAALLGHVDLSMLGRIYS